MSHVDEGALHAYLDGALEEYPTTEARRIRAHLERCERCAEALVEARLIRDRAESVLAAPELKVTPPPLEELKRMARSGTGDGRAAARWGRRQRLGWAASVAVALGIGWIVRGGMPAQSVGPDRGAPMAEAMRAADADPVSDDGVDAVPSAGQLAENVAVAPEPTVEIASAEAREGGLPAEEPSVVVAARQAAPSPGEMAEPVPAAPRPLPEVDATSVEVAQAVRIDDELGVPVDVAGTDFTPSARDPLADLPEASEEVAASAGAPPTMTGAGAAEERESAPRSEAARLSLASQSATAGAGLTRGSERARAADPPRDDDVSEPGSLVVPGLEVLSIVWREEGVVPAGVRVIQRLDVGQELELIHLPAGFDPSAVSPAEAGVNELVVPRDQGWLILRAAVEESELRALLERMDAPDPDR